MGLSSPTSCRTNYFEAAFFSNYLEHLSSNEAVVEQRRLAFALLLSGGHIIILQPIIRLIGGAYWDFIDHQTPLTEKSLAEAATMAGFNTKQVITRFVPYTTKSRLPRHRLLVRAYLACKPAWWLFGKQTLYVGQKHTPT